jgi:hypothetical protein
MLKNMRVSKITPEAGKSEGAGRGSDSVGTGARIGRGTRGDYGCVGFESAQIRRIRVIRARLFPAHPKNMKMYDFSEKCDICFSLGSGTLKLFLIHPSIADSGDSNP